MNWLARIPMASIVIIVGAISAIGWIVWGGTIALVISIVAGSTIALRATLGDEQEDET